MIPPEHSALLTDLYQLTMLQAYFVHGMTGPASFEFFIRKLPERRNFLLAAGLEQVLEYLEAVCFTPADIAYLREYGQFRDDFLDRLSAWRFRGQVDAMPEGTVCFPNEPLLRVTAPLPDAQLVESRIINLLQFQTLIASKAVRCRLAAGDRTLIDFGMRRAHGAEAGLLSARADYLAGFDGTATVLAGERFGMPLSGTMAHSFIQAHDDEQEAFFRFGLANPDNVVLLIDTIDTEGGARKVVEVAQRLQAEGIRIRGVRLDSGDLADLAKRIRRILDDGDLREVKIFASGGLDEDEIAKLVAAGAPIDGFGVGTRLDVSADAPYLDCAYKLVEYDGKPRFKLSQGKSTLPGRKQVYRLSKMGTAVCDVITLADVDLTLAGGEWDPLPLLHTVMADGRRVGPPEPLNDIRERTAASLASLPQTLRTLNRADPFPVLIDAPLQKLVDRLSSIGERGT
jgi:nicotinate phosphoribosyltransferase